MEVTGNVILRSEAMKLVLSGQPFDMEFVTADRRRGTGGELKSVKKWMKLREDLPNEKIPGSFAPKYRRERDSNNWGNRTLRIFDPADRSQHPITVHFRLIISFNQKTVLNG